MDIAISYGVVRPPKEYKEKEKYNFKYLKKCGWDAVNYSIDSKSFNERWPDSKLKKYYTDIRKAAEQAGMYIAITHGHGGSHPRGYDCNTDEMFECMIHSIKATHYLGCKDMVMHPYIMPGRRYENLKDVDFAKNIELLSRIKPYLEKYDVYCCIENMWVSDLVYQHICRTTCSRFEEIVRMCEILGDRYKICIDTGHCDVTDVDPVEAVKICGDRLYALHCHDTDSRSDTHTIPFTPHYRHELEMETDWIEFAKALKEVNFKGVLTFETSIPGPPELDEAFLIWHAKAARYIADFCER